MCLERFHEVNDGLWNLHLGQYEGLSAFKRYILEVSGIILHLKHKIKDLHSLYKHYVLSGGDQMVPS